MKQNRNSPTFCILPFIHVNAAVTGNLKPCCNTHKFFKSTDREMSLLEAFHSEEMQQIREDMNNGKKPDICDVCWKNEEIGIKSQRAHNNNRFHDYHETELQFLDIKFDNKCNLQCRMCDPYSSDQIWKTMEQLEEIPGHLKHVKISKEKYENLNNSAKRKEYIIESLPNLRFLKFTGGEPFISKDFLDTLEYAVETGHSKHITLSITTNGTKFTSKVTKLFKHFEGLDMNMSVDGCFETYDYIRYPFKWDNWYSRVVDFLTDMEEMDHPNFDYRFSTVVTAYNYLNLCDLQKQIDGIVEMFPTLNPYYHYVNSYDFDLKPSNSELHAKFLPNYILKYERDKAQELFKMKFSTHPLNSLVPFVDKWTYEDKETEETRKELKKSALILDKVRNQTYKSLNTKLVEWLDE